MVDNNWPKSEVLPEPINDSEKKGIQEAIKAAAGCDAVLVVAGDGPMTIGENKSRTSLDLPGRQNDLIEAMVLTGRPVVLVLINGRPISINWPAEHVPAILAANMPAAFGGRVIAEALFDDYNPSGKLTTTWPKTVGQIPMNFPTKPNAQWESDKAANVAGELYPFGFGLSYSKFEYTNLQIAAANGKPLTTASDIAVDFDIRNVSSRPGTEIAEIYTRDVVSSVTTYEKQLSGFERIDLRPGEMKHVRAVVRTNGYR